MEICSHGHEEIAYETRNCPFCTYINEVHELSQELENRIETAEENYENLVFEYRNLKKQVSIHAPELLL